MAPIATDVSQIDASSLQQQPFPASSDFRVAVSERAYDSICSHVKEFAATAGDEDEAGGVLIGELFKDASGVYLDVTDAIRGEHAAQDTAQVTFTHDTWAHILEVKDSQYPDKQIVGWYHSHPRFGIFLSQPDLFIHNSFFSQPWHVAFVIDPVGGDEGFFVWRKGNPEPIDEYWVAGTRKSARQAAGPTPRIAEDAVSTTESSVRGSYGEPVYRFLALGSILIIGLFAALLVRSGAQASRLRDELHREELLTGRTAPVPPSEPQQTAVSSDTGEISNRLKRNAQLSESRIGLMRKGETVWCSGLVVTGAQKDMLAQIVSTCNGVNSVDVRHVSVTHRYKVSKGDTLTGIAGTVYGNQGMWGVLFHANERTLAKPDLILPSTILNIPEPSASASPGGIERNE